MTSRYALRSLAIVTLWGMLAVVMGVLVVPTAEAGWPSYAVAVGTFVLYVVTCAAFVRERRRPRRWT